MSKVAIVILADTEGGESLGRVVNALTAAKEFQAGKDDVQVMFTGAGTKWIGELEKEAHQLHALYGEVKGVISGACSYCANAFGVSKEIEMSGVPQLEEYGPYMSFRQLIQEGYQVLMF